MLDRGQAQESGDGRRWLDGAIFDITVRRAAEQALREREVVEAQLAEVRASRARILDTADRARREIERNLHDGAQQRFVSVALELQRWLAPDRELSDEARGELQGVLTELRTGLGELRDLARGLHPAILTDRGLERALTALADHATVPVELRVALPNPRLAMSVEAAAYFTVCEALTNVAKHARATHAWVNVEPLDGHLGVEVGDDGAGGADRRAGSGLQGLRDRIAADNGTLTIDSQPGTGTVLQARLPIDRSHPSGVPRPPKAGPVYLVGQNLQCASGREAGARTAHPLGHERAASLHRERAAAARACRTRHTTVPPGRGARAPLCQASRKARPTQWTTSGSLLDLGSCESSRPSRAAPASVSRRAVADRINATHPRPLAVSVGRVLASHAAAEAHAILKALRLARMPDGTVRRLVLQPG